MSFGVLGEHGRGVTEHFGVNVSVVVVKYTIHTSTVTGAVDTRLCSVSIRSQSSV